MHEHLHAAMHVMSIQTYWVSCLLLSTVLLLRKAVNICASLDVYVCCACLSACATTQLTLLLLLHTATCDECRYGKMEVHCRLLLPIAQLRSETHLPTLHCQPLHISMARVLRPHSSTPNPEEFMHIWNTLPVKAELPATALWPGVDGMLLALSALARQPLHCSWLRALPTLCGAQAAYITSLASSPNDTLAVILLGQLMPTGGAGSSNGSREVGRQRAVWQVLVKSSSHEAALAVKDHADTWLHDISQVCMGFIQDTPVCFNRVQLIVRAHSSMDSHVQTPGECNALFIVVGTAVRHAYVLRHAIPMFLGLTMNLKQATIGQ